MIFFNALGRLTGRFLHEMGGMALLLGKSLIFLPRRPYRWRYFFRQLEFIGVNSLFIVILTGLFTGMVLALQGITGYANSAAKVR